MSRGRGAGVLVAVLVALYALSLVTPLVSPFARYPLYLVKCGGQPVVASDFAASYTYRAPGSDGYGVTILTSHFFCTVAEAERAGFRRDTLPPG
ncbi:hypothetical protein K7640_05945 [Micromonospora sp. PLK6-60]|uniref:sunset domain-containing protein n=1 Tax=Micromonospora sp. PLK6-60 TaxID=2873383 RepID=UPI001CA6B5B5|nr:hypothetical protein [Micromonospora sp. PLK6-60]MBY8871384.1 hypothetical protein [Micromonospora sp. PLK6-60]